MSVHRHGHRAVSKRPASGRRNDASEDIVGFIASSFRSVWALELLLLLKGRSGPHTANELVILLRASDSVVREALAELVAGGLVIIDEQDRATYQPASERLAVLVDGTQDLYARRSDAVRREIVAASTRGMWALAEAFRLRKD
jgi:DNA-binding transcriptional ArsR family regulator